MSVKEKNSTHNNLFEKNKKYYMLEYCRFFFNAHNSSVARTKELINSCLVLSNNSPPSYS